MIKLISRFFILTSVVIFVACLAGFSGAFFLYYWGHEPYEAAESTIIQDIGSVEDAENGLEVDAGESRISFTLERGQSLSSLSKSLESQGLLTSSIFFQLWVRAFSDFRKFQAGTYRFSRSMTPSGLAESFINGQVYSEPLFEISIPEGYTLSQVVQRFLDRGIGTREEFVRLASSQAFLRSLSISAPYIEGYLYPATYRFYEMPDEALVFTEMVQTFWKRLPEGYERAVASRGITLNQAIIMASLIEAETAHDDERSMVSEVIWKRIARNMTLGIDAAVIYGAKDYQGTLRKKHLEDRTNPYNLRIYQGLPPTPITSPSVSSLKAVLTPTNEGYLFYVLDPDQGTRHTFTRSLEEHNKAVKKLVAASKKR
jgi:UPF0755 protein